MTVGEIVEMMDFIVKENERLKTSPISEETTARLINANNKSLNLLTDKYEESLATLFKDLKSAK